MTRTPIGTAIADVGRRRSQRPSSRAAVVAVLAVLTVGLAGCGDPDGGGGGGGYLAAPLASPTVAR
jgi:hypothetical protein